MSNNSRRMIYPYTLGAKLAQFPFKYYWEKSPFFRMYLAGVVLTIPIFHVFTNLSNSPANYEKFKQLKEKDHEAHLKHLEHQL